MSELRIIPLAKLRGDPSYQQAPSQRLLAQLTAKDENGKPVFDPKIAPPLLVADDGDEGGIIIDGIHRAEAMRELGLDEVLCLVEPPMSECERAAKRRSVSRRARTYEQQGGGTR